MRSVLDIWVGTLRGEVKVFARPAVPAVPERAVLDLRALRGLGALSDVVLRAAGVDFPVHKNVLAARSPVFLTMFTGAFKVSLPHSRLKFPNRITPLFFAINCASMIRKFENLVTRFTRERGSFSHYFSPALFTLYKLTVLTI